MLFSPTERCFLDSYTQTQNYVVLELLDNVLSKVVFWKFTGGKWLKKSEEMEARVRGTNTSERTLGGCISY